MDVVVVGGGVAGIAVEEAVVMKWPIGNCYPVQGASVARTEGWNRRVGGRVVLAGDYFAPAGGTLEVAVQSGSEAAAMLRNSGEWPVSSGRRPGSPERKLHHE